MNPQLRYCIESSEVTQVSKQQLAIGWTGFIGIFLLIIDTKTAFSSAAEGVALCIQTLLPSLLPFFVFSAFITQAFTGSTVPLLRPIARLFHIPPGGESLLVSAFLGGYPVGAQSVAAAYSSGSVSRGEAERLLAYCSNAGPSFLFGITAAMFSDSRFPWLLWGIHIISAWMVSRFFPPKEKAVMCSRPCHISFTAMMSGAVKAMASVCGWVILFKIILGFFEKWFLWLLPEEMQVIFTGFLELANGCCSLYLIEDLQLRFIICSGMLAFGGLCVAMQTISVIKELSVKNYLCGKLLHMIFCVFLSALLYRNWKLVIPLMLPIFISIRYLVKKSSSNLRKAIV